jgi:hypothetical protein
MTTLQEPEVKTSIELEFRKYPHIIAVNDPENLDDEIDGIFDTPTEVTAKVDGANCSWYWNSDFEQLIVCSRNRILNEPGAEPDAFRGLLEYISNHPEIEKLAKENPSKIFYGEWLIKNAIVYPTDCYNEIYLFEVFDVETVTSVYLIDEISKLAERMEIKYPKILLELGNHSVDEIKQLVGKTESLGVIDEGVVIKSPTFINKWGRRCHAKIVNIDFKEQKRVSKTKGVQEEIFAYKYVTEPRVRKIISEIELSTNRKLTKQDIPQVIGRVYKDAFDEGIWDFSKKGPIINFKLMKTLCAKQTATYINNIL